jgi:bifunctional NMN adenylyltransferase/nudix hydrolase
MRIGVVIGRFQVPELHAGHRHLLDHVRNISDKLHVFVGVSPVDGHTAENPLTFSQRQTVFDLSPYNAAVLPLFDQPSNEAWSAQLDRTLLQLYPHDQVILYGGRDSFTQTYLGQFPITNVPIDHTLGLIQGRDVREGVLEATSTEFLRGQVFALGRQFPHAYPTVDVAALGSNGKTVLLIQRKDNGEWGFVGGFVDPTDPSLERAAARELNEETGLGFAGPADLAMDYVASMQINDWRYRGSRDKIVTTFFCCYPMTSAVRANPDEVQDWKWVPIDDCDRIVTAIHQPLLAALKKHLY